MKPLNIGTSNTQVSEPTEDAMNVSQTLRILHCIPDCGGCDEDDTAAWLNNDRNDPDWQILSDEEIVALTALEVFYTVFIIFTNSVVLRIREFGDKV